MGWLKRVLGLEEELSEVRRYSQPVNAKNNSSNVTRHKTQTESRKEKRLSDISDSDVIAEPLGEKRDSLELYVPIREAKIFIHSILVDKLGDLTKFIIQSIYHGQSIDDIQGLTMMGIKTIQEEVDYLIKGGLLSYSDHIELTDLGNEYGRLLDKFESASGGIQTLFDTCFVKFMANSEELVIADNVPENALNLHERFSWTLARNDNFSNSRILAIEHISKDIPFCEEIMRSLYTTVSISGQVKYKKTILKDMNSEIGERTDETFDVVTPITKVEYRIRYSCIDKYRPYIDNIIGLNNLDAKLLSARGKSIITKYEEEQTLDPYTMFVNMTSIEKRNPNIEYSSKPKSSDYVLAPEVEFCLKVAEDTFYIDEITREKLYWTRIYSYKSLENQCYEAG